MRNRSPLGCRALLALLLLVVGTAPTATVRADDAASGLVPAEVHASALREGKARVIVELRLAKGAHLPEGLLSSGARRAQRDEIAAAQGHVLARLATRSHRVLHRYETVPFVTLEAGPDALMDLEAAGFWVARVMPDTLKRPTLPASVPLIGADSVWARGYDGSGMVVAIIDTGVDSSHPFLAGKVVEEACYSSTQPADSATAMCPNGSETQIGPGAGVNCPLFAAACWHGTHVAGIAAGNGAAAGVSFSGVAKGAQIMALQVFSRFDSAASCSPSSPPCIMAYTSDIIAGLERVYALRGVWNFSSVNMSLGGGSSAVPCDGEPEKPIIDNLRSAGIATVVAAGNSGSRNALSSPGCISSAISVGATTKTDGVASFSNVASFMSLFAPGQSITSSVAGGGFGIASGTSMATPHVTGAWAILKQAEPSASVDELLSLFRSTGVPITDTRSGGSVTTPRIQIDQALALPPTVTSVTPTAGVPGATVPVTINGSGFTRTATISFGPGIAVGPVTFVSAMLLRTTLTIAGSATVGARDVTVTNPGGGSATLPGGFNVTVPASLTLAYNGKLRDRVGLGNTVLSADGALDGTLTATLSAPGGRTVTALTLASSTGARWDTTSTTAYWALGVAATLDGALLNAASTMAVSFPVTDGGSFVVFASEYLGIHFVPGTTLALTAKFSDGLTATASTTAR